MGHRYVEGQARSNGTRYSRHEVCQWCGLVHQWGGDEATGVVVHHYRLQGYEHGMLHKEVSAEPECCNECGDGK